MDVSLIESQKSSLKINEFINEAGKYTNKALPDIDLNNMLNSAIKGEINNKNLFIKIIDIFFEELLDNLKIMRKHIGNNRNI